MNKIDRKTFIQSGLALGAGIGLIPLGRHAKGATKMETTQVEPNGFFTLGKAKNHCSNLGRPDRAAVHTGSQVCAMMYFHLWIDRVT